MKFSPLEKERDMSHFFVIFKDTADVEWSFSVFFFFSSLILFSSEDFILSLE